MLPAGSGGAKAEGIWYYSIMTAKPEIKLSSPAADPAYASAIESARAEVDAGKTVPYEKVRRWLLSWGTEKELPRPRCK
jgi:predicted transcriptional regulator